MSVIFGRPAGTDVRRPVVVGIAGKAAELATLLLLATMVPRVLGPEVYGLFAVALTVVTLGSVAMTLGGPTLLARYVPAVEPAERMALARELTTRLARGRAAQLLVLVLLVGVLVASDPERFPVLVTALVLTSLALNVAATLALQLELGLGHTLAWSMRYPLQNAVLVASVLVLHDRWGATGAVVAILLSALTAFALGVLAARPVLQLRVPSVPLPEGALRFGVVAATGGALSQAAHRGGIIAVALLAGSAAQIGYAALAIGVALAATYAVVQLFTVSLPELAKRDAADSAAGEAVLRRLAGGLVGVLLPVTLGVALTLDPLVPLLFGPSYVAATAAFGPALALVVLAPLTAMAPQVAALRLQPTATLYSALAGVLAVVVLAVATVPTWGALGATVATTAGAAVNAAAAMVTLPGAFGTRLAGASMAGAGLVAAAAALS